MTAFVERLYKVCFDRDADDEGLANWCGQLWDHSNTGRGVASGFVFSDEFKNMNLDDDEFVEYMYLAFFDRGSDSGGKADWLNRMDSGWSREQVFDGFVGSVEFDKLCKLYGIVRE